MTNPCTKATHTAYLKKLVQQDVTIAEGVQNVLEFGFEHYNEHGDSRYLSSIYNAGFRALDLNRVTPYVKAHSNLKLVSEGEGAEKVFKFTVDANSEIKERTIALPVTEDGAVLAWDAFTPPKVVTAFDIDKRIKALITQAKAALEGKDGKQLVKTCSKKHAKAQIHHLEDMLVA